MRSASLLSIMVLAACGDTRTPPPARVGEQVVRSDQRLIEENKRLAQLEETKIQAWVDRNGVPMISTGTGLRFKLVRDLPGDTARPGQMATLNYVVTLLNGDTCYASVAGKPQSFRIEHAQVESGLHEGVQHLSVGDSAVLVIPSALAFGLLGDREKIPMRSTVVYHVGLVKLGG